MSRLSTGSFFLSLLLLFNENVASVAASEVSGLPRKFGPLWLGMPTDEFTRIAAGQQLAHCATCVEGELYSELPLRKLSEAQVALERFGLVSPNSIATIDCFFFEARLYSMRVGLFDISPRVVADQISSLIGTPQALRVVDSHLEIEWSDDKTTITVSGTETGLADIIVIDINIQSRVTPGK